MAPSATLSRVLTVPVSMLFSRPTAVIAMVTTLLAVIVVIIKLIVDADEYEHVEYRAPSWRSFFLGFGTILFSFGGAATFPTIQNDMVDRTQFPKSVAIAFLGEYTVINTTYIYS